MRAQVWGVAAALVLLCAAPAANPAFAADPTPSESFAQRSLKAGRIQAALARLAALRGENPGVKRFAEALVRDFDARNARLARLARPESQAAPLSERAMIYSSARDIPLRTRELHRLRALDSAAFDKQFLKAVIVGHENAIRGYAAEERGGAREVRAVAAEALPRLRQQLAEARRLLDEVEQRR